MIRTLAGVLSLLLVPGLSPSAETPLQFQLTFDKKLSQTPFTGRVFVMLSANKDREPRQGPNWFNTEPFFALDVKNWQPNTPMTFAAPCLGYPTSLDKLKPGTYSVQAVMDFDRGDKNATSGEGNAYSKAQRLELDPQKTGVVKLTIDTIVGPREFVEADRVKLVDIESKLLTKFHGKTIRMKAGVALPKSYDKDAKKRYPVIYEIPGFGGRHHSAFNAERRKATEVGGVEFIHVTLDPDCRLGHHVFADSANNGPCGKALVEELIPAIEKKFRALAVPTARFVTGHSSGGWSSLWLQVTYPDFFGGVWSTAPDPVDFRDFQRINLYKPGTNMFTDEKGEPRPIARRGGKAVLFYKGFSDMEHIVGRGGQLASFEACFSQRGSDGKPRQLWDRATGTIDLDVAKSWEPYDIRLVLERNWKTLEPKLRGKIHVYMGEQDTFYLEGATILLKESLKKLGSDAVVEIFPGRDHGTLMDAKMRERIHREMAETFLRFEARAN